MLDVKQRTVILLELHLWFILNNMFDMKEMKKYLNIYNEILNQKNKKVKVKYIHSIESKMISLMQSCTNCSLGGNCLCFSF